ncbi:MAG: hypothetical protein ACP5N1_00215 [Candidatus Woesearchaeota archaeon]
MKNTYVFMIIQALLISLLFFSEGYVKYVTIALFLLFDLVLFVGLLTHKWSFKEFMIFAAIFCSGMFIIFYIFNKSLITTIFGVALMLLFLVIALLELISQPIPHSSSKIFEKMQKPDEPDYYYDIEYNTVSDINIPEKKPYETIVRTPEPVMHIKSEKSDVKNKLAARAVANELEKEASQLKNAEKLMKDLEIYNAEKELLRESKALEDAQRQINSMKAIINKKNTSKLASVKKDKIVDKVDTKKISSVDSKKLLQAKKELKIEAAELLKVQRQIDEINQLKRVNELKREANELQNAQKKVSELNFSNKQEQLTKQAKSIEKAQKQINAVTKLNRVNELQREAKELQSADKKINEIKFLNKQEQLVKQAKSIAKAQKEIDEMNKDTKKSLVKQKLQQNKTNIPATKKVIQVKTIRVPEESFYFATENSNKFHEPGCLSIKKVPKNKLTLYTSKKDAMKKGLQACNVCMPK